MWQVSTLSYPTCEKHPMPAAHASLAALDPRWLDQCDGRATDRALTLAWLGPQRHRANTSHDRTHLRQRAVEGTSQKRTRHNISQFLVHPAWWDFYVYNSDQQRERTGGER